MTSSQGRNNMKASQHQCPRPLVVLQQEDTAAKPPTRPWWTASKGASRTKLPAKEFPLWILKQWRCDRADWVLWPAAIWQSTWCVANDMFCSNMVATSTAIAAHGLHREVREQRVLKVEKIKYAAEGEWVWAKTEIFIFTEETDLRSICTVKVAS